MAAIQSPSPTSSRSHISRVAGGRPSPRSNRSSATERGPSGSLGGPGDVGPGCGSSGDDIVCHHFTWVGSQGAGADMPGSRTRDGDGCPVLGYRAVPSCCSIKVWTVRDLPFIDTPMTSQVFFGTPTCTSSGATSSPSTGWGASGRRRELPRLPASCCLPTPRSSPDTLSWWMAATPPGRDHGVTEMLGLTPDAP